MRILNKENLPEAVEYLQAGKTIIFPTETSYGLGCDATNQDAVNKIFKIKGRRSDKPLLVVVPTIEMAKKYLVWNNLLDKLASNYWPGPLTVVGEYNNFQLANGVVSANNTIAIRVTNHPVAKYLSEKLELPVVATSANLADAGDVYDVKKVIEVFSEKPASRLVAHPFGSAASSNSAGRPDIIIDGGVLPHNPPTTIVSVVNSNLKILRQGQIKIN